MTDLDQNIKRINDKLQLLLKDYSNLQKENEKLKGELNAVKQVQNEKDDQLQLFALRIEVLKASKGSMTEDEKKAFEKKINQYLREIDKCIALLNE
ncbi:MAG TPA: hypothetical protein VEZ17_11035 [Chitinophagaceae bacterium]|jgi:chromosome segregation ATPase|nr:hypothetical protein [Chitinophagaceae bacterium]